MVFKRTGEINETLTVGYSVLGSADNATDLKLLRGEVTFPARKRTVKVPIKPLDDRELEGAETVEIRVLPGDGYTVALKGRANVAITDNERRKTK